MRYVKIGLFFLVVLVIYFSFGFHHIGKFITADEHLWVYDRIPQYWDAISKQNWKKTYVHEKPGITLSIISGTALLKYPNPSNYLKENRASVTGSTKPLENMLSAFRVPILIFNAFFSFFFFWILFKITKKRWVALWSSILILLSPILLGASQIVNADSLVWTFATATILSFIAYLDKNEKKFIFLTGLFLGLSMLTKFSATVLIPFIFIISIAFYLEKINDLKEGKNDIPKKLLQTSLSFFSIIAISLATFAILLPDSFIEIKRCFYEGTIGYSSMPYILLPIAIFYILIIIDYFYTKNKITIFVFEKLHKLWKKYSVIIYLFLVAVFFLTIINYIFKDFLNLEKIPFDARQGKIFKQAPPLEKILLEARPLIFSFTPIVVFFCFFVWIKSIFYNIKERFLVFSLSTFIIVYIAAVLQQELLNIVRYNLIIYPAFSILAAIGLDYLIPKNKKSFLSNSLITSLVIFFSFVSIWQIKPFYFNYTNFLLSKKYIILDSWGYGGYEAATKLNSIPGAEKKIIWSDYYGVCEFFKGTCLLDYSIDQKINPIDYFVLTRRGGIRYYQKLNHKSFVRKSKNLLNLDKYYKNSISIWELNIDERPGNFVKIIPR